MTANEYQQQAMTLIDANLSKRDALVNCVMGLCGEAGEAMELVKKWLFHGAPLDQAQLEDEFGDIAWYLAEAATALGVPMEKILQGNLEKIRNRFPDGYADPKSLRREQGDQAKYNADRASSDR